jgi:hypothetical protein
MPGDYTRVTFDPFEDHLGVLMQQGRVLLDADFNELVEILDRRLRAGTMDSIGRCAVPRQTPDGFRIQIAGASIAIGRGRIYVDGLLAECHGLAPREFDRALAEERGTLPIPYEEQPYLPNAAVAEPFPGAGGPYLVYVDVWQREITHLEELDLIEKAVGVDTATRLQTVWQVRWREVPEGTTCSTPVELTPPSAGRLSTAPVGVPQSDDPCIVDPAGGYRGTENRLYRVEVHDPGPLGTATFKWSRDNASIATAVTGVNPGRDQLTVVRTARDAVLRFSPDDWVEVTDDWHELWGLPGVMRKVSTVDDVTQVVGLAVALPVGEFDTGTPAARHTRVRRWDQKGQVFDSAHNVIADVDAGGGLITVPAAVSPVLEDGVQVTFGADPAGGDFHTGDYWVFAARTVDASIEELDQAPPRGIHHHYCRLALVTLPGDVEDCRPLWPPELGEGCCTVVVEPGEDIQAALDSLPAAGGCVCLKAGVHAIRATLRIERPDVSLHGESPGAVVRRTNGATLLRVGGAAPPRVARVRVASLGFELVGRDHDPEAGAVVALFDADDTRLSDCRIAAAPGSAIAGVGASGCRGVRLSQVRVAGTRFGVVVTGDSEEVSVRDGELRADGERQQDAGLVGVLLADVPGPCQVEGNRVSGYAIGIALNDDISGFEIPASRARHSRVVANRVERFAAELPTGAAHLYGIDVAADDCLVADNVLSYAATGYAGIRLAGRRARAAGNALISLVRVPQPPAAAIGVVVGRGQQAPADFGFGDACVVEDNRILGVQVGVWVAGSEAVVVRGNLVAGALGQTSGVVLLEAQACRVAENRFTAFGTGVFLLQGRGNLVAGNRLSLGGAALVAAGETGWGVEHNDVESMTGPGILGFQLHDSTRLAHNRLRGCATQPGGFAMAVGIVASDFSAANEVVVESCEVLDTGVPAVGDPVPQARWGIFVWALGCTLHGNLVAFRDPARLDPQLESRAALLFGFPAFAVGNRVLAFGQAALLDNKLVGPGRSALVEVARLALTDTLALEFERVSFNDNDCFHFSIEPDDRFASVSLHGIQMIAQGNQVRAMTPFFSFDFHGNRRTLFLGNVTDGGVLQYPAPRPAPVAAFNFVG